MSEKTYQQVQPQAFGDLVREGVYAADFEHPPVAKAFFQATLKSVVAGASAPDGLSVLDCGCGPGYWLNIAHETLTELGIWTHSLYGFDITPEMVDVARARLGEFVPADNLRAGDILEDGSYEFGGSRSTFDLIFAYDVIQQLPRPRQADACMEVVRHLSEGGIALIFDQDWQSRHGLEMEVKKFITRHLRINLVPPYYCNARYPGLRRLGARIERLGRFAAEIRRAPDFQKRVLIVRSTAPGRAFP